VFLSTVTMYAQVPNMSDSALGEPQFQHSIHNIVSLESRVFSGHNDQKQEAHKSHQGIRNKSSSVRFLVFKSSVGIPQVHATYQEVIVVT
jgi:hypothetical protein